ncbi:molybdopterin-dependent oxidoreductase [Candidatus Omnitrophota bacterium]
MENSKPGSSRRGEIGRSGMNRRTFIKLSGLTGAAIAASRVINYPAFGSTDFFSELTDAEGVITENWIPTSCLNCATRCATRVRVVNGKAVKVNGNPLSQVSEGENCARAHIGLQVLYDQERITTPLKRTNPAKGRGIDPQWAPISWEQALSEVSERLKALREKGQTHQLLLLYGLNTVSDEDIIRRFAYAYGTPNIISADGLDNEADKAGEWMADGNYTQSAYDLPHTNYILSFGASILESYKPLARSLRMWGKIRHERPNRAKVVVIDPRYSVTALRADQWLPINPGTDGALAMAIANVIISEGLYDANFIRDWTEGFDEYKDLALNYYSPESVSDLTGISADTIYQIAREFAQTKPAIAWRGRGATSWPNGSYSSYAIFCLNALVGSIDIPGGVIYQENAKFRPMPEPSEDDIAKEGKSRPRLDLRKTIHFPAAEVVTNQVADSILENKPYPSEMAIGFNSNFNMSAPGAWRWDEALKKVSYYVHIAPFASEMAEYADILLPAGTFMEEWAYDHSPPGSGFAEVRIKQPVVEPLYDTKGIIAIVFEVAKWLGGTVAQSFTSIGDDAQGFVKYRTGTLMPWEEFIDQGVWVGPAYQYYKYDRVFHTPSKKFEFRSGNLEALFKETGQKIDSLTCLPHYEEVAFLGDSNSYPLLLSTYQPLLNIENGSQNYPWAQEMFLVMHGMGWTNFAEINSQTAQALGIEDCDMVYVESPFNRIKVKARVFEGIHPGVVSIASGQGHYAYGRWAKGIGVNPNDIIGVDYDRLSGQAAFFNTRVRVYKA